MITLQYNVTGAIVVTIKIGGTLKKTNEKVVNKGFDPRRHFPLQQCFVFP